MTNKTPRLPEAIPAMTIPITKKRSVSIPSIQTHRLLAVVGFCVVYVFLGHTVVAQSIVRDQQGRTDRVNQRVDEAVRDLSAVMRQLAAHESTIGHPEMAARVLALESKMEQSQLEIATFRGQFLGGGVLATALIAGLQILGLLGVRLNKLTP